MFRRVCQLLRAKLAGGVGLVLGGTVVVAAAVVALVVGRAPSTTAAVRSAPADHGGRGKVLGAQPPFRSEGAGAAAAAAVAAPRVAAAAAGCVVGRVAAAALAARCAVAAREAILVDGAVGAAAGDPAAADVSVQHHRNALLARPGEADADG